MSFTIEHEPNILSGSGEPIYYKFKTTDPQVVKLGIVLFKQVGGSYQPVVDWGQEPELGTTDTYIFQLDEIIEDMLSYDLPDLSYSLLRDRPRSIVKYGVYILTYSSPSTVLSAIGLLDRARYAISSSSNELLPININDHFIENGSKYFLTRSPANKTIALFDHEYLDHVWMIPNTNELAIKAYQKDGSVRSVSTYLRTTQVNRVTDRLAIGPDDLNKFNLGFIDEQTKHYTIALRRSIGNNLFTDGDGGTFNSGISNISSPSGSFITHDTTLAWHGNGVIRFPMGKVSTTVFEDVWQGDTLLILQPGATYEFTVYVTHDVGGAFGETGELRVGVSGFTDATLDYTVFPIQAMADPGEYFYATTTIVTVGNDNQGRLVLQKKGPVKDINIYCDNATIYKMEVSDVIKTYVLDHECHTDATRVHFLNSLGGFDSFTFVGTERQSLAISGDSFDRRRPINRKFSDRGGTVLQKEAQRTLSCSSGPLTPEDMAWLEELLVSPAVYVERDDELLPVILKNGEFEVLDRQKNIHKLNVQFQLSNTNRSQRN